MAGNLGVEIIHYINHDDAIAWYSTVLDLARTNILEVECQAHGAGLCEMR